MATEQTTTIEERRTFPQQRAEEVITNKNVDAIDDHFAPDWVGHINGEDVTRVEYKEMERQFNTAFPDAEISFGPLIVEGDTVAGHWQMTATHTGEAFGVEPTGRTVHGTGTFIVRFDEEDRAVETWETIDHLSTLQQLGIAPDDFTPSGLAQTLVNLVKQFVR
jgi:predicted ester cyclase